MARERKSEADLRDLFNKLVQPKLDVGLYTPLVRSWRWPPATVKMPAGTKSTMFQIVEKETGYVVAHCHAYVLPNGAIGASGKLDPKEVRDGSTTYVLAPPTAKKT